MTETDPEYMANVFVSVSGDEDVDAICSMLRGLLYSNKQSSGQATKNKEFQRGIIIRFGNGPMARKFIETAEALFSKSALRRIDLQLRG